MNKNIIVVALHFANEVQYIKCFSMLHDVHRTFIPYIRFLFVTSICLRFFCIVFVSGYSINFFMIEIKICDLKTGNRSIFHSDMSLNVSVTQQSIRAVSSL